MVKISMSHDSSHDLLDMKSVFFPVSINCHLLLNKLDHRLKVQDPSSDDDFR